VAEEERLALGRAAQRIIEAGLPCPILSVGATPTATLGTSFEGISEIPPGIAFLSRPTGQCIFRPEHGACGARPL